MVVTKENVLGIFWNAISQQSVACQVPHPVSPFFLKFPTISQEMPLVYGTFDRTGLIACHMRNRFGKIMARRVR